MIPLYHDHFFTFRFADDRIIPRFHLEGVGSGGVSRFSRSTPALASGWAFWRQQRWVKASEGLLPYQNCLPKRCDQQLDDS
jgi:hypothetical protein